MSEQNNSPKKLSDGVKITLIVCATIVVIVVAFMLIGLLYKV